MTIKLKTITVISGEVEFRFEYDDASGLQSVTIPKKDLDDELKVIHEKLDRDATLTDFEELVNRIINDLRAGEKPLPTELDFARLIDVEIESK